MIGHREREKGLEATRRADLRDYLAAERTFLAWIRTGLALMGFGFVVARFGLFLQQLQVVQARVPSTGLSLWFGTALIVVGVVVNLSSARRHLRLVRELDRGEPGRPGATSLAVATALLLAVVGLLMALYLVSVRNPSSASVGGNQEGQMTTPGDHGLVRMPSHHSVDETVERLKEILRAKGVTLFALVDHSGEAEKVGMRMPPTKLLIFGSPAAGTPLMLAAPSVAIDLPLKILVSQDTDQRVWISYNSPDYLKDRHGVPVELLANIAVVEALAAKAGG
jgi:uncharacterized protein (DUF302 family)/uncharacterized membrane protein YidH (DUF202 family)